MEKEDKIEEIKKNVLEKDLIVPSLKGGKVGLNLGCGEMYLEGWCNCDKRKPEGLKKGKYEEAVDLNKIPYIFDENYADYIILHHVIEHVPRAIECINECYRILKPNGKLIMHYPHYSGPMAYQATHVHFLGRNSFNPGNVLFQKRNVEILVSQFRELKLINKFINSLGTYYEKANVCYLPGFGAYEVQWEGIK